MFVAMMLLACGGDGESTPTADTGATTAPAGYTADWDGVQNLFADHCDSCHPATNGIDLRADIDTYVVPGDPDASRLWESLQAQSISTMMPPSGKLPDEDIAHVEAWILAGAPR
jgi:uncharacterized membrane protein